MTVEINRVYLCARGADCKHSAGSGVQSGVRVDLQTLDENVEFESGRMSQEGIEATA